MTGVYRDRRHRAVRLFRWFVFALAGFYVLRQFVFAADYSEPGGPFRFLTHWALLLSFASASRMLAVTEGRSDRDWGPLVGVAAVVNALVVFLYWRLFLEDPALVNSGTPVWWVEYYIHGAGPLLQWIDALFVFGAFRHVRQTLAGLAVLVLGYIGWIEMFVQRFNDQPAGTVTSGLPYPFLNSMEPAARAGFYATTGVTVAIFLGLFWGLAVAVRRLSVRRS